MSTRKALKNRIEELSFTLITFKDLYKQSADSRDFWRSRANWATDRIRLSQNKLRDEQDLCDQLSEFVDYVTKNFNHLTPADITRARILTAMHKEARRAK